MGAIILFLFVYLLMLFLSIALVVACVYAGLAIVSGLSNIWGILAGLGLVSVAVMVFVFLVKFLFAVSRFDKSGSIEVTEEEQPQLFAFVRQVAKDTQAPFPKKILLSPDVNAAVFYDSSFWSMVFPVRKNLLIGLGMVNTVNLSEFKAVVAHEFGHFSQRSMKLGSVVYNLNKIIHNMLFENSSYSNALGGWARLNDIFHFFATVTVQIAKAIQWVLRYFYGIINKSYMGLSREMEFHADAVAASVSGSKSLVTALRRVELGQVSYNSAIDKCNELLREKKYCLNIFRNQQVILQQLAADFKLSERNGLPVVSDEFLAQNNASRLNVKNQWASHPALEDREQRLRELAVEAETMDESAWILFRDKETLQAQLTRNVYQNATANDIQGISDAEFETWFRNSIKHYRLPDDYNGYYDGRFFHIPTEEEENAVLSATAADKEFEEIFSVAHAGLNKQIQTGASDLQVLKAIASNEFPAETFDFEGTKYDKENAQEVAEKVELDIKQWTEVLKQMDLSSVRYFITHSSGKEKLQHLYQDYFHWRRRADQYLERINGMLTLLAPIFSGQTLQVETIQRLIAQLKHEHEPSFKRRLEEWVKQGVFEHDPAGAELAAKYLRSDYVYFGGSSFFETELAELDAVCRTSWAAVHDWQFRKFKHILELQLQMREEAKVA
jgi:Zn-dependent protease with chaperone function